MAAASEVHETVVTCIKHNQMDGAAHEADEEQFDTGQVASQEREEEGEEEGQERRSSCIAMDTACRSAGSMQMVERGITE